MSTSNYYRLVLQYNGTGYYGWQVQPNVKTIQGELNKVLSKISKNSEVKSIGSGRTDAGVHANGQVVRIAINQPIEPLALMRALNSMLPEGIRVLCAENSSEDFNPVFDAQSKDYHYYFTSEPLPTFLRPFCTELRKPLDIVKMREAASLFIGEHDFQNFMTVGTPVKSTIRKIFECEIVEDVISGPWQSSPVLCLKISGNGFLKQMVRLVIGAIWRVGEGKLDIKELQDSLKCKKQNKLSAVAPAQGLYLQKVVY